MSRYRSNVLDSKILPYYQSPKKKKIPEANFKQYDTIQSQAVT